MKKIKYIVVLFLVLALGAFSLAHAKNKEGKNENDGKNKIEKMHKKFIKNGGSESGFKLLSEGFLKIDTLMKEEGKQIKEQYKSELEYLAKAKDFDMEAYNKLSEQMLMQKTELSRKIHNVLGEILTKLSAKDREEAVKLMNSNIMHSEK